MAGKKKSDVVQLPQGFSWEIDKVAYGYIVRLAKNTYFASREYDRLHFSAVYAFSTLPEALEFIEDSMLVTPAPTPEPPF